MRGTQTVEPIFALSIVGRLLALPISCSRLGPVQTGILVASLVSEVRGGV